MDKIQLANSADLLPTSTKIEEVFTKRNLRQLTKEYSEREIITAVAFLTQKYISAFNVGTPMNAEQILLFAEDFYETYYTDTLDDLKLMFKEVRLGNIGKVYNRIDGQVIFEWYRVYLEKKYEAREKMMQKQKDTHSNALQGLAKSEGLQKVVEHFAAKVEVEKDGGNALTHSGWVESLKDRSHEYLTNHLKEFKDRAHLSSAYDSDIELIEAELSSREKNIG